MRSKAKVYLGSISTGTMRTEDLYPAFLSELERLNKREARRIEREYESIESGCKAEREHSDNCPTCEERKAEIFNNDLWFALQECAPDYCYFGAHEGDGADYGFWISWDSLDEDCRNGEVLKVNDLSEVEQKYRGLVLLVNDHGNATLYYRNARKAYREIWSCV